MFNKKQTVYCSSEISIVHDKRKILSGQLIKFALDLCTVLNERQISVIHGEWKVLNR